MSAKAGYNVTITGVIEILGTADGEHGGVLVGCNPSAASGILVNVKTLHGNAKMPIYPGGSIEFTSVDKKITQITVEPISVSSIVDWGVTRD